MMEGEEEVRSFLTLVRSFLTLVTDTEACRQRLEALTEAYDKQRDAKDAASLVKKQIELSKYDALKVEEQVRREQEDLRVATLELDRRRKEAEIAEASSHHAIGTLKDRIQALDHREALLFRREEDLKNKTK